MKRLLLVVLAACCAPSVVWGASCQNYAVYMRPDGLRTLLARWERGVVSEGSLVKSLQQHYGEVSHLPQNWFDCGSRTVKCARADGPFRIFALEDGDVGHFFRAAGAEFRIAAKLDITVDGGTKDTFYLVTQQIKEQKSERNFWVSSERGVVFAQTKTHETVTSQMILTAGAGFLSPLACKIPKPN